MTIENRIGQPADGQVPYSGGLNQPPEQPPGAVGHGAGSNAAEDKQRPVEGARPPTETPGIPEGIEIEIVDVGKLEAEKRERELARMRAYTRRRYHETKQAALAGDENAQQRWQRMQQQNRESQKRWREKYPEQHLAKVRDYKRRKKLWGEQSSGLRTESADPGN